jgi:AraC family transcriptional regulator
MKNGTPGGRKPLTPEEWLDIFPFGPVATSGPLGWSCLRAEHHRWSAADFELDNPGLTHHLVVLYLRPPDRMSFRAEGLVRHEPPAPGSLVVIPAGAPARVRWRGPRESVYVLLGPRLFARVAAEACDLDLGRVTLPVAYDLSHPPIRAAMLALQAELTSGGAGGRLLAQSLGNVLAVHLLRQFAAPGQAGARPGGGLPRKKLRAVLEYIEEHLDGALTLDDLAAVAHLSRFHFARLFKHSTGLPPHQYVVARRVERAKGLLRGGGGLALADVAAEVGFACQSHLTRHFQRLVGVTPGRFQ